MNKKSVLSFIYSCFSFLAGAALFGVSMNMFLSPGKVVMGGATGIATVINYLVPTLPIGIMIMVINAPLLLLNAKYVGAQALFKTVSGIVVSSVMIDTLTFLPVTMNDPLLCAVLGGVTMGAGAGMMLTRGFTTGGSDLAAVMLKRLFRRLTTGRIILIIDALVVAGSAIVMKSYEGVLYSAVSIFAYSATIDAVMGGAERAKVAYIVSTKYEAIASEITEKLGRGITLLTGSGWYTGEDKRVIMCVVKRHEEFALKMIIEKSDPAAFMILSDATEVVGMGFKSIEDEGEKFKKNKAEKKKLKKEKKKNKRFLKKRLKAERREAKRNRRLEKKNRRCGR